MSKRFKVKFITAFVATVAVAAVLGMNGNSNKASAADNIMYRYEILHDQSTIEQKKAERDQAKKEAEAASQKVDELSAKAGELQGDLAVLNQLSEEQYVQYQIISGQLAEALIEKANALDDYVQAQENLESTQKLFSDRVSVMFEYQNKSTLEILLESDNIAGFFTNMEIITLIADSDSQAVDLMTTALDDAQLKSDKALAEADSLQGIIETKQSELDELEGRIGVTSAALESINADLSYYEQQEDELNELASQLDSQIAELQRQQAAAANSGRSSNSSTPASSTGSGNGTLSWPTWTNWVTSYYGNRVHPITGEYKFHSGIDIGAGYGDSAMAAAGGTVIYVDEPCPGCNTGGSGYGNYVIIDHGNGISTLYAHLRDAYVYNGQSVSRGECIGEVGSTGTSSGAHLHFEVRVNGSTVDPLSYL